MTKLAIILEGPIAFDGITYKAGKGEALYINSLAANVEQLYVCAYVLQSDHPDYEASNQTPFAGHNIHILDWPHDSKTNFRTLRKFYQLFQLSKIYTKKRQTLDFLYILFPGYPAAITSFLATIFRQPYAVYLASDWPEEANYLIPWKNLLGRTLVPIFKQLISWFQNNAVKHAKFVLTAGPHLAYKYKGLNHNIDEIIPRINWDDIQLAAYKNKCGNPPYRILCVTHLIPRKGTNILIEALSHLEISFIADIVGDGPECENLKDMCRQLNLSNQVIFHGQLSHNLRLIHMYQKADIFILPTLGGEGFPRVLYEALSQGTPIITSDVCGIPMKLPHKKLAYIVEPGNPKVVKEAIEILIKENMLTETMIRNGLQYMEKFLANSNHGLQFKTFFEKYAHQK